MANLTAADLTNADLVAANLSGAIFEPKTLPDISSVAFAQGLSAMTFRTTPISFVELREAFKKHGLRQAEREITHAIKRSEREHSWQAVFDLETQASPAQRVYDAIGVGFSLILFELPSGWGMDPGRLLRILGLLIVLFAFPYWLALQTPTGSEGGIWAVWSSDRTNKGEGDEEPALLTTVDWSHPRARRILSSGGALAFALYFSLLSAFHIGWRDLNVGTWLTRLQPREYTLRPTRWVRTVSGVQSLISVYLVALWILTYFGRPFE